MDHAQAQVDTFMRRVCSLDTPDNPVIPTYDEVRLCIKLMQEELNETIEALWKATNASANNPNGGTLSQAAIVLTEVADGLADLVYVTLYTANVCGIDLKPVFDEVQHSNMTKIGGIKDKDGKLQKPNHYEPADILPIIRRQMGLE